MPHLKKNGASGKGSGGGEERMWTLGKMTKEERNSLVHFAYMVRELSVM